MEGLESVIVINISVDIEDFFSRLCLCEESILLSLCLALQHLLKFYLRLVVPNKIQFRFIRYLTNIVHL